MLWPFRRTPSPSPAGNPVLDWLDAAGLPWRSTRQALAAQYSIRTDDPYRWEAVALDIVPPPLTGLLRPFSVQMLKQYSPLMPPGSLSAHVHVGGDAERNIRAAADQFAPALGPASIVTQYNTRTAQWRCGPAVVRLTAWPPALQTGNLSNPAHQRDPRLATACSITVQSGYRPPLSPTERLWLDGFVPMGTVGNALRRNASDGWFKESEVEFTRAAPDDAARFTGRFGLAADKALIFGADALYVIALPLVTRLDVARTLPAKGGGGARLLATCRTGYDGMPLKQVQVASGEKADDLNEVGAALAAACGKPFALGEYNYDC